MRELSLNCSENRASLQRGVRQTAAAWTFLLPRNENTPISSQAWCMIQRMPNRSSTTRLAVRRIRTVWNCGLRNYYRGTLHWYWSMHPSHLRCDTWTLRHRPGWLWPWSGAASAIRARYTTRSDCELHELLVAAWNMGRPLETNSPRAPAEYPTGARKCWTVRPGERDAPGGRLLPEV